MRARRGPEVLRPLLGALEELREATAAYADAHADRIAAAAPDRRQSAANLLHYLALRRRDLRALQRDLARLGLSSLGRLESCTLHTLDAVTATVHGLLGEPAAPAADGPGLPDTDTGPELLRTHATELLGPPPRDHSTRVMVTMPGDAADDPGLVRDLLAAGTDVVRINAAHDDPARWTRMVANVRAAAQELGRQCRILVDLAGPKLRTGALEPGPAVLRVRPERDEQGRVLRPALVRLLPAGSPAPDAVPVVPLVPPGLPDLRAGDLVTLRDARGRRRRFAVSADAHGGCAGSDRTTYLVPGAPLVLERDGQPIAEARIAPFAPRPGRLRLGRGDEFLLTRTQAPGGPLPAETGLRGRIPCTLQAVFEDARPGEPIWFDDGRIGGVVVGREGEDLRVRVDEAPTRGAWLRAEKGINLPRTELRVAALTERDLEVLDWAVGRTDLVGLSFARSPADVRRLHDELRARGGEHLGVILKIESRRGFEQLPAMLLEGLCSPPFGIMVARGDLAVEVGFARLAELQEEILWLCEAAHVPVIWATQVLDTLARTGKPSRPEVTDAAMGVRAECVMLNKGPFAVDAVRFLQTVLGRMQAHQDKKRTMLRRLAVVEGL